MGNLTRTRHPFYWNSNPTASFVTGIPSQVDLSQFVTNPEGRALTFGTLGTPRGRTVLERVAAQLGPRQWARLPCVNLSYQRDDRDRPLADIVEAMPAPDYGVYECAWNWGNQICWDDATRRAMWMGSNHYTDGQSHNTKYYRFSELTNRWKATSNPTNNKKTGHTYSENALDPVRRLLWKYDSGTDRAFAMNVDTDTYWGGIYLPAGTMGDWLGWGRAMVFHEAMDGLVWAAPASQSIGGGSIWCRRSLGGTSYIDRTWEKLADNLGNDAWHMLGHYHALTGRAIFGGGAGEGQNNWKFWSVAANGTVTNLPDCPRLMSVSEPTNDVVNSKRAQFVADPSSRKSVIFYADGYVYEFDHDTNTWGTEPVSQMPVLNKNGLAVPIPRHNVILWIKWGIANTCQMWLYRNSPGGQTAEALPQGVSISGSNLTWDGVGSAGTTNLRLFCTDGDFTSDSGEAQIQVSGALNLGTRSLFAPQMPEVAFVEGYSETEHLGLWVLSPQHRTNPGDLFWKTGSNLQRHARLGGGAWVSPVPIQYEGTLPVGCSLSTNGVLTYTGAPIQVGRVSDGEIRLKTGTDVGPWFRVRVMRPSVTYLANDSRSFSVATAASTATGSDADPHVVFMENGIYTMDAEREKYAYQATTNAARPRYIASITRGNPTTLTITAPHGWTVGSTRNVWLYGLQGDLATLNDKEVRAEAPFSATAVDTTTISVAVDTTGTTGAITGAIVSAANNKLWRMPTTGEAKYLLSAPGGYAKFQNNYDRLSSITFDQPSITSLPRIISYTKWLWPYMVDIAATTKTSNSGSFGLPQMDVYATKCILGTVDADNYPGVSTDGFGSDAGDGGSLEPNLGYSGTGEVRKGLPLNPWEKQQNYYWNIELGPWTGSGTSHPSYVHGRPEGYLIVNNMFQHGANAQYSVLKTTRAHCYYRNSLFWTRRSVYTEGLRDTQTVPSCTLDLPNNSDAIFYNLEFVSWRTPPDYKTAHQIWLNPRRTLWGGNDGPGYPEICFQPESSPNAVVLVFEATDLKTTSGVATLQINNGSGWADAPAGTLVSATVGSNDYTCYVPPSAFPTDGVYKLRIATDGKVSPPPPKVGEAFITVGRAHGWLCITSCYQWPSTAITPEMNAGPQRWAYDQTTGIGSWYTAMGVNNDGTLTPWATDPANPYTWKQYFSYVNFTWLRGTGELSGLAHNPIHFDGTAPRSALQQFGTTDLWGPIPKNFHHGTTAYMANMRFDGWNANDLTDLDEDGNSFRWIRNTSGKPVSPDVIAPNGDMFYGNISNAKQPPNIPYVEYGGFYVTGPGGVLRDEPEYQLPDWWKI